MIDVSTALGRSSEEALGSSDAPDVSTAGTRGDDGDVSKTGRGSRWPRFGFITALAKLFR